MSSKGESQGGYCIDYFKVSIISVAFHVSSSLRATLNAVKTPSRATLSAASLSAASLSSILSSGCLSSGSLPSGSLSSVSRHGWLWGRRRSAAC